MNNPIRDQIEKSVMQLLNKESKDIVKDININGTLFYASTFKGERATNQDRVIIVNVSNIANAKNNIVLALIADGMGGMMDGAKAASIAISSFVSYFCTSKVNGIKTTATESIKYSNSKVFAEFNGKGGATFTGLILGQHGNVGINIGDSRIYEITENTNVIKLTKDDTIAGQLSNNYDDTWSNPTKADNRLVQFVGMGEDFSPHIIELGSNEKTSFLLTTDGVHYIGMQLIHKIAEKSKNNRDIIMRLNCLSQWLSGHDNGTMAIVPSKLKFNVDSEGIETTQIAINTLDESLINIYPTHTYLLPKAGNELPIQKQKEYEIKPHLERESQKPKKRKTQKKKKDSVEGKVKTTESLVLEFIDPERKS